MVDRAEDIRELVVSGIEQTLDQLRDLWQLPDYDVSLSGFYSGEKIGKYRRQSAFRLVYDLHLRT